MEQDAIFREIERIAKQVNCPKNIKCAKADFRKLCKARDIGLESYLECLEDNPAQCKFALSFGKTYLCTCAIRIFIAKKLGEAGPS